MSKLPFQIPSIVSHRGSARGAGLIEVLVAAAILAVGALAHVSSSTAEYRLVRDQEQRARVLFAAEQFVERMRSEPDWSGRFSRLREKSLEAVVTGGAATRLKDGRKTFSLQDYCPDWLTTDGTETLRVLVDPPPCRPLDADPNGAEVLREDTVAPSFGLPADLNSDGVVDGMARDSDYTQLPVVVVFRWTSVGGGAEELRVPVWLGELP